MPSSGLALDLEKYLGCRINILPVGATEKYQDWNSEKIFLEVMPFFNKIAIMQVRKYKSTLDNT